MTSADVGAYVKEQLGEDATPKDFRTWHATVLAARGLADAGPPPRRERARRRVVTQVVRDVAEELGQHPGRVPRVVHRPAGDRPLGARARRSAPTRSQAVAERETLALLSGG